MLTINECREQLDDATNASLSDADVEVIRDQLYELAKIALSTQDDSALQ